MVNRQFLVSTQIVIVLLERSRLVDGMAGLYDSLNPRIMLVFKVHESHLCRRHNILPQNLPHIDISLPVHIINCCGYYHNYSYNCEYLLPNWNLLRHSGLLTICYDGSQCSNEYECICLHLYCLNIIYKYS